eukprot:UC4_evm1s59
MRWARLAYDRGSAVMMEPHSRIINFLSPFSSCAYRIKSIALRVGDSAEIHKRFDAKDVADFARLSGDDNPLHLDSEYAKKSMFGRPIVHGVLMLGVISSLIGTELPGPGTIYMTQDTKFRSPLYVGDEFVARVEITDIREKNTAQSCKYFITLSTTCVDGKDGRTLMTGEAKGLLENLK